MENMIYKGTVPEATARFVDRQAAGRTLARELMMFDDRSDVIVLALPRGGVPVGYEVARALSAPLDVVVVRKLGVPGQPETAFGAIAGDNIRVLNREVAQALAISERTIATVTAATQAQRLRRERHCRQGRPSPDLLGRVIILVDDGIATGATLRAALIAIQRQRPSRVIVAVPVASPEACADFSTEADACVCLTAPAPFVAVSHWYEDFTPPTDEEVIHLLTLAR